MLKIDEIDLDFFRKLLIFFRIDPKTYHISLHIVLDPEMIIEYLREFRSEMEQMAKMPRRLKSYQQRS